MIYQIIIEPFETREAALEAEHHANRTEYPKFNVVYNDHSNVGREIVNLVERRGEGAM